MAYLLVNQLLRKSITPPTVNIYIPRLSGGISAERYCNGEQIIGYLNMNLIHY